MSDSRMIAEQLKENGHIIIDHAFGPNHCQKLREALLLLHAEGALPPGETAKGSSDWQNPEVNAARRGDFAAWLPPKGTNQNPIWEKHMQMIAGQLMNWAGEMANWDTEHFSKETLDRLKPSRCMGAVYPAACGAGFVSHLDNPPNVRNGRILTAVYYCNAISPAWDIDIDGGALQIFEDNDMKSNGISEFTGSTMKSITPLADRLVVFWSKVTRHAVEPTIHRPRCAVTVWLEDTKEMKESASYFSNHLIQSKGDCTIKSSPVSSSSSVQACELLNQGSFGMRLTRPSRRHSLKHVFELSNSVHDLMSPAASPFVSSATLPPSLPSSCLLKLCLVSTMARPPLLKAWLSHHQAVGVAHIFIFADSGMNSNGAFENYARLGTMNNKGSHDDVEWGEYNAFDAISREVNDWRTEQEKRQCDRNGSRNASMEITVKQGIGIGELGSKGLYDRQVANARQGIELVRLAFLGCATSRPRCWLLHLDDDELFWPILGFGAVTDGTLTRRNDGRLEACELDLQMGLENGYCASCKSSAHGACNDKEGSAAPTATSQSSWVVRPPLATAWEAPNALDLLFPASYHDEAVVTTIVFRNLEAMSTRRHTDPYDFFSEEQYFISGPSSFRSYSNGKAAGNVNLPGLTARGVHRFSNVTEVDTQSTVTVLSTGAVILHYPFCDFNRWLHKAQRDLKAHRTDGMAFYKQSQRTVEAAASAAGLPGAVKSSSCAISSIEKHSPANQMTWLRSHYLRDVVVRKPEETKQNKEEAGRKKPFGVP